MSLVCWVKFGQVCSFWLFSFVQVRFDFVWCEKNTNVLQKWRTLVLIRFPLNTNCLSGRFCRSSLLNFCQTSTRRRGRRTGGTRPTTRGCQCSTWGRWFHTSTQSLLRMTRTRMDTYPGRSLFQDRKPDDNLDNYNYHHVNSFSWMVRRLWLEQCENHDWL